MRIKEAIQFTIKKARTQVVLSFIFKVLLAVFITLFTGDIVFATYSIITTLKDVMLMIAVSIIFLNSVIIFLMWYLMLIEGRAVIHILKSYKLFLLSLDKIAKEKFEELDSAFENNK
jgi:hypothetical protein